MKLEKLPMPDGAPYECTLDLAMSEWPYVERCRNRASGVLSEEDYQKLLPHMALGGRMVCTEHALRCGEILREL